MGGADVGSRKREECQAVTHMRSRSLGGLLAAVIVFAACSSTSTSPSPSAVPASSGPSASPAEVSTAPASSGAAGGDKRIVYATFETIDSAWALETDDAFMLTKTGVAETLTETDFDGALAPLLATAWKQTGDLTWEFTLRDGVKFQDGTPLDAAAVVGALNHLLHVQAPARSFNPKTIASVEAVGSNVVRVTSVAPNVLVPYYVASPNTVILDPKAYAGPQIDPMGTGTGPFTMVKADLPQSYTLDRNASYWGGSVGLAGVEVRLVPKGDTRATLIQTGEAQIASSLPITSVPTLTADSNISVADAPLARTNTLYLNNQKAPLNDVRVRQAIQAAIDTDSLSKDVLEGSVVPASGPFAANAPYAPKGAAPVVRDVEKAKSLLTAAGIAPGTLTLGLWTYPSRPELPDVAVALQSMLKDAGINVEVRVADYAALEPDVLAGKFDMMIVSRSYLIDINDPAGYLASDYGCAGGYNLSHFCDKTLDSGLSQALANPDPSARNTFYASFAAKLEADAVDVFLYNPQEISAIDKHIQNYRIHPLENFLLTSKLAWGN